MASLQHEDIQKEATYTSPVYLNIESDVNKNLPSEPVDQYPTNEWVVPDGINEADGNESPQISYPTEIHSNFDSAHAHTVSVDTTQPTVGRKETDVARVSELSGIVTRYIAKAVWDYNAQEDNELSFKSGQILLNVELCNNDWFSGSIDGNDGYFPANRVAIVQEMPTESVRPSVSTVTEQQPSDQLAEIPPIVLPDGETENPFQELGNEDANSTLDRPYRDAADVAEIRASSAAPSPVGDGPVGSWIAVTNDDNEVYYWNVDTGETSWEHPFDTGAGITAEDVSVRYSSTGEPADEPWTLVPPHAGDNTSIRAPPSAHSVNAPPPPPPQLITHQDSVVPDNASPDVGVSIDDSDSILRNFGLVPPELVRREGYLGVKLKREDGGLETWKSNVSTSWKNYWAVVCVGFLAFYKDQPSKGKRNEKLLHPVLVLPLHSMQIETVVSKEQTRKKGAFSISTEKGAQWLLLPPNEGDLAQWMDAIYEATKERSTTGEYENAVSRVLPRQPSGSPGDVLPNTNTSPPPVPSSRKKMTEAVADRLRRSGKDKPEDAGSSQSNLLAGQGATASAGKPRKGLGGFFRSKDSKTVLTSELTFGGDLEIQLRKDNRTIPLVMELCIAEVEKRGIESQGIYRLSGNKSTVEKFRTMFNQQDAVDFSTEPDINVCAALLKLYLRELHNPLIPFDHYDRFIEVARVEDRDERLLRLRDTIYMLPEPNFRALETLLRHLQRVAEYSHINKMEPANLAIVFGPSLLRTSEDGQGEAQVMMNMLNMSHHNSLVEAMIEYTSWIFDQS
ncbi:hypothetical protein BJ742DRAFT_829960 [Cladochytrium replicatum]|nr:hypothetical protein BJ742DRAFT_829960 [Cladochytrium replicatum]